MELKCPFTVSQSSILWRPGTHISSIFWINAGGVKGINFSKIYVLLYTVASTSHSRVINSSKLRIEMLSVLNKIFFTQQIKRFHHPVHQRAVGRVNFYLIGVRSSEETIGF